MRIGKGKGKEAKHRTS